MTRFATGASLAVVVVGVGAALLFAGASSQPILVGACLAGIAGVGAWQLGKCHHPRPLALLPPLPDATGEDRTAHWFCSNCGRTWPVVIDRPRPPVQVFVGHDESKAREAARRAATYEGRLRELSIQRAGLKKPAMAPRRPISGPVPIHSHRAVR